MIISQKPSIKKKLNTIMFNSDTRLGLLFDILLIATILISILIVLLESIESINTIYKTPLKIAELTITTLFSIRVYRQTILCEICKKLCKKLFWNN